MALRPTLHVALPTLSGGLYRIPSLIGAHPPEAGAIAAELHETWPTLTPEEAIEAYWDAPVC